MIHDKILKQMPSDPVARKRWLDEKFELVSIKPKIILSGVTDQEPLRRFVDLPKLFDLMARKRLVLPRLQLLIDGDPFECYARRSLGCYGDDYLRRRAKELKAFAPESEFGNDPGTPVSLFTHDRIGFDREIQGMATNDLRDAVWYLERERLKRYLACSCWYKGTIDSDAMWRIYTAQLGVSITSSAARLKKAITLSVPKVCAPGTKLHLAAVHYDDSADCGKREPWLVKRRAFEHEKEVRLYYDVPYVVSSRREVKLEVNLAMLIEEITITPFAAPWQSSAIKVAIDALLKQAGVGQIKVQRSKHMSAPAVEWPPDREQVFVMNAGMADFLSKIDG